MKPTELRGDPRYAPAKSMQAELVVNAVEMAITNRRPEPGMIHHSDSSHVPLVLGDATTQQIRIYRRAASV